MLLRSTVPVLLRLPSLRHVLVTVLIALRFLHLRPTLSPLLLRALDVAFFFYFVFFVFFVFFLDERRLRFGCTRLPSVVTW